MRNFKINMNLDQYEALHNVKKEYEDKLAKAQAKQPKAEW